MEVKPKLNTTRGDIVEDLFKILIIVLKCYHIYIIQISMDVIFKLELF